MTKKKAAFTGIVFILLSLFLAVILFPTTRSKANAEEAEAEPLGWFARVSVSINGGNGQVWATAKNEFTLFSSVVQVYVELYFSYEYQEKHEDMILVERKYIYDLDQGETLTVTGDTNGQTLYWQARARMKKDSSDWKETTTGTILCDGEGNWLKTI